MDKEVLKSRTKQFALRIIKLVNALPKTTAGYIIGKQVCRSGTSTSKLSCRLPRPFKGRVSIKNRDCN